MKCWIYSYGVSMGGFGGFHVKEREKVMYIYVLFSWNVFWKVLKRVYEKLWFLWIWGENDDFQSCISFDVEIDDEAEGRVKRKSIKNNINMCVQKCYTSSEGWYTNVWKVLFCIDFGRNFTFSKSYIFISREDEKVRVGASEKSVKSCVYMCFWCFYMYLEVFMWMVWKLCFYKFWGEKRVFWGWITFYLWQIKNRGELQMKEVEICCL